MIKLSVRHQWLVMAAFIFLLLGFMNYVFFHPDIILLRLGKAEPFKKYLVHNTLARHIITGYFSDVAWCVALCGITVVLSELNYLQLSGKIIILTLPFITETAQYFGIIRGTFDWYDTLTYAVIIFFFVLFFPTLKKGPK